MQGVRDGAQVDEATEPRARPRLFVKRERERKRETGAECGPSRRAFLRVYQWQNKWAFGECSECTDFAQLGRTGSHAAAGPGGPPGEGRARGRTRPFFASSSRFGAVGTRWTAGGSNEDAGWYRVYLSIATERANLRPMEQPCQDASQTPG